MHPAISLNNNTKRSLMGFLIFGFLSNAYLLLFKKDLADSACTLAYV